LIIPKGESDLMIEMLHQTH